MELCENCGKPVSDRLMKNGVCMFCETAKKETVEKLKARIVELELELLLQKKAAEKGEKLRKVMWGDDFNDDSLH